MSDIADRVKKIVVEHLGVEAEKVTEDASFIDDLGADSLDIVDVETAILNGRITKTETDDPRGPRYTVHGVAADGVTPTGCVGRFTDAGRYLIITAYEVTDE